MIERDEQDVDGKQEGEDERDHDPGNVFEHSLDRLSRKQDPDGDNDHHVGQVAQGGGVSLARHMSDEGRKYDRCAGRSHGRHTQLGDRCEHVTTGPKLGTGTQAHDPGQDGFAGVQRVANSFQVEQKLQRNRDGGDPQNVRAVLDGDCGARHPFAHSDGTSEQDCSGADRADHVPQRKRRRRG